MPPINHFTQYGFDASNTASADDNATEVADIDDAVLEYDSTALLGNAAAPVKKETVEVAEEPSPDIQSGDGHSTGGNGKCLGQDLRMRVFTDPLFVRAVDGTTKIVEPEEVRQGQLNNCPLPAVLAAMAHVPWGQELTGEMIKTRQVRTVSHRAPKPYEHCPSGAAPAKSETYVSKQLVTVTFRRTLTPSASAGSTPPFLSKFIRGASVTVTRALYYEKIIGDEIYYASSANGVLWPSLIEKAYAVARGKNSYEGIERFIYPHFLKLFDEGKLTTLPIGLDPLDVMKDVADVHAKASSVKSLKNNTLRSILKKHLRRPTIADTKDTIAEDAFYVPDHVYTVIGYDEKTGLITLYNAAGGSVKTAKLSEFREKFDNVFYTTREK